MDLTEGKEQGKFRSEVSDSLSIEDILTPHLCFEYLVNTAVAATYKRETQEYDGLRSSVRMEYALSRSLGIESQPYRYQEQLVPAS